VGGVLQLDPTAEEKRQARAALLRLLGSQTDGKLASALARRLAQLDPTAEEQRQARAALLRLAGHMDSSDGRWLMEAVVQLAPTANDQHQARDALLGLLVGQTDSLVAKYLVDGVAQLDPTARDLSTWRTWAVPPTTELLTAARRNSALAAWLTALPWLASISDLTR
jgi:hypothetical protein